MAEVTATGRAKSLRDEEAELPSEGFVSMHHHMARAVAPGGTGATLTRRANVACDEHELRRRLEAEYRAAFPEGKPHYNQLDALVAMVLWLARCYRVDGPEIHRTWTQMVGALENAGVAKRDGGIYRREPTVAATIRKYRHTLADRLTYLQAMGGWIESWEPKYEGRESVGILIHAGADVAQLARATSLRRRRGEHDSGSPSSASTHRRSSISGTFPTPSGVGERGGEHERARSANLRRRAARDRRSLDGGAAPLSDSESPAEGRGTASSEETERTAARLFVARAAGRDPVEVLAEILEAADDPLLAQRELLVATFERAFAQSAKYSPARWDEQLFEALERLDRMAGKAGAGCAELIEAMEAHATFLATDADELRSALARVVASAAPTALMRPKSFAFYVLEARYWVRQRQPEVRLQRRVERAERICDAHDIPLELFRHFLAPELRRHREGNWCRVRLALKRTVERFNTVRANDPLYPGFTEVQLHLYGANNPRWNKTWRNW